jgi:hypothetical protein
LDGIALVAENAIVFHMTDLPQIHEQCP